MLDSIWKWSGETTEKMKENIVQAATDSASDWLKVHILDFLKEQWTKSPIMFIIWAIVITVVSTYLIRKAWVISLVIAFLGFMVWVTFYG